MKDFLVLAVVLVAVASVLDWRRSVKAVLVLLILEGAIRKWLVPSASEYVYFLKDLILGCAYAGYFLGPKSGRTRVPVPDILRVAWIVAGVIVLSQAFNPNLGSAIVGLYGSKSYLFYMPLCVLMADLFRTPHELRRFLRWFVLLAIPVCLLGVLQFVAPIDSPLNTYVVSDDDSKAQSIAAFGEVSRARITGTFSYISGHVSYILVCTGLVMVLWAHAAQRKWKLIFLGALVLLAGNALMTGSRSSVFSVALLVVLFALVAVQGRSKKERRAVLGLLGASVLCVTTSMFLFSDATDAFVYRSTNSDNVGDRITGGLLEPFDFMEEAGLLGFGAGITQPGGQALINAFSLPAPKYPPPPSEGEPLRVLLEVGVLGFFAWYTMRVCVLWLLWRTYKDLRTPWLRHLALVAFLIHAISISGQVVLNPTMNLFYWFLGGFIFLLPRLDKMERAAQQLPSRPSMRAAAFMPAPRRAPSGPRLCICTRFSQILSGH